MARIKQEIRMNEVATPKVLKIRLEGDTIRCYFNNKVLAAIQGDMMTEYLVRVVQVLQDEHNFDIIDLDVQLEMNLLYDLEVA